MAVRTPFDKPESHWLRVEQACFGFRAQREGALFDFEDTFFLIEISGDLDFALKVDTAGLKFTLVEYFSERTRMQFSLDDVQRLQPVSGDFDMVPLKPYEDAGLSPANLKTVVLARDLLLRKLQSALDGGFAQLHARIGTPLELHFTRIPGDVFRAFRIIDFEKGMAEASDGSRLFSLYVAPEGATEGASRAAHPHALPPKQSSFARFLIANYGGLWPNLEWKPLLKAFSEWTDVRTGHKTKIGRSTAAHLKRRFPDGFNLDQNPLGKIGR